MDYEPEEIVIFVDLQFYRGLTRGRLFILNDFKEFKFMYDKLFFGHIQQVILDTTGDKLEGFKFKVEFLINYTDQGHQVMVLEIGAPVSLAGKKWLEQYLGEFYVTIEEMESSLCNQVFKFGQSEIYFSIR